MAETPKKPPSIKETVEQISKACGLPSDFLTKLFNEADDWSFVIKTHAFLESVVCTLLAAHLNKPELESVFAEELEMHQRIELLGVFSFPTPADRRMMRALGKLRNRLVHNASQTRFTFDEYLKNKDIRKHFAESFGSGLADNVPMDAGKTMPRRDFVLAYPKMAIWQDTVAIAGHVAIFKDEHFAHSVTEAFLKTTDPSGPEGGE